MGYEIMHWIDGRETAGESGQTQPIMNPATGGEAGTLHLGDAATADRAVQVAVAAQAEWGKVSLARRTQILYRMRELMIEHTDEIAEVISREHGKTIADARGEIARGLETLEFATSITQELKGGFSQNVSTGVDSHTLRQPLGVVAGITPFNFPAMVPFWMHPIAIATGNAFILKPSERDPSASNIVARLYQEAGLPDGVFQVVHGGKTVVDALCTHDAVAAVSFVGSTPIAKHVHATASAAGKRVQALGGANNHAVVMPDANIEFAASQVASGACGSAGERCMAVPVAVTVGDSHEAFLAAIKAEAEKLREQARTEAERIRRDARAEAEHAPEDRARGGVDAVTRRPVFRDGEGGDRERRGQETVRPQQPQGLGTPSAGPVQGPGDDRHAQRGVRHDRQRQDECEPSTHLSEGRQADRGHLGEADGVERPPRVRLDLRRCALAPPPAARPAHVPPSPRPRVRQRRGSQRNHRRTANTASRVQATAVARAPRAS